MEHLLEIYRRPYDPMRPLVCMDESTKQLLDEIRLDARSSEADVQSGEGDCGPGEADPPRPEACRLLCRGWTEKALRSKRAKES
jgi:hypothetical protein